jgi:hypothetical protein
MKRNNAKKIFRFRLKRKIICENKQNMSILFCLEAKWLSLKLNKKLMKQNTAKKIECFYFCLSVKNFMRKKQKDAKKSLLQTKCMRNGSLLAS